VKISIIIPAHNEQARIKRTLETYYEFFKNIEQEKQLFCEYVVVLNGCKDNTLTVVQECAQGRPEIRYLNLVEGGKGLAVKAGFADALTRENDLIGFVDADMATQPRYFYDLITQLSKCHGAEQNREHDGKYGAIIASRYMPGASISPKRPWVKTWGRKIFYNSLVRALFDLNFYDYQCGAKLFRREALECVVPRLTSAQWAFDVELLYLTKKAGFSILEAPTVWHDQEGSKLKIMGPGTRMLTSLFEMKKRHKNL
jgi:glycosyltransferase involved in cell wall biosynthesis